MSTMKLLFCAACLCSAGVFVKSAMTQEKTDDLLTRPTQELEPIDEPFPGNQQVETLSPYSPRRVIPGENVGQDSRRNAPMRPRNVTRTITETIYEPITLEELEAKVKLHAAIAAAMQQLKTGKDDATRKAATETIQQQLTTQFEADLKQREKELAEVEQRVKSLREQLDKRKAAQADIINLRLQTLINDANGLGFPETGFTSGDPPSVGALALPPAVQTYEPGSPGPRARRPSDVLNFNDFIER